MPERSELLKQALAVSKRANTESEYSEAISLLTTCIQNKPDSATLYSHRAKAYLGVSQFQRALFDYSMAIRLEPACGRHFASRAACFKRLGRVAEALRDFSDAIRFEKENPASFFFERGLVHYEEGAFDQAIPDFTSALDRKFPDVVKVLLLRGISNRKLQKISDSIADLRQAVSIDPSSPGLYNHLGLSLASLTTTLTTTPTTVTTTVTTTSLQQAITAYTSAIELDANRSEFFYHRGLAQYKLHDYGAAVGDLSKALAMDSRDGEVWYWRGNSYLSEHHYAQALEDFNEAIKRDGRNAKYHHHRGLVLESSKQVRQAIEAFETALKWDSAFSPAKFHLAVVFHLDGQTERALDLLADFDEQGNAEFYERRGLILGDLRREVEALRDFDEALELAEKDRRPELWLSRGRVLSRMGEMKRALEDYDGALSGAKDDGLRADIFWERGKVRVSENDLNGGVSDFTRAVDLEHDKVEFFLGRAETYIAMGLYEMAESDLERSDNPEFLYKRGLVRYALKKYNAAVKDFEAALEAAVRPTCLADLLYHLGVCLANCGQHTPAVEAFSRAIERETQTRPHYFHERAKSLQEIGRHREAVDDFSSVINWQPKNPRAYFRRAFSYKALKNFEEAADDFETAKNLDHKEDPRLSVNYRKIANVQSVSLGPCGFEDTYYN